MPFEFLPAADNWKWAPGVKVKPDEALSGALEGSFQERSFENGVEWEVEYGFPTDKDFKQI